MMNDNSNIVSIISLVWYINISIKNRKIVGILQICKRIQQYYAERKIMNVFLII